ncbi:MAG: glycosyltransferase family 4 protein [Planctomycetota bacterium]
MHDNSLARAMRAAGDDVLLQPIYTPIRTDEVDVAGNDVFFGGIQVYALQRFPWLTKVPRWARSWMDSPRLLRWVTAKAAGTDPSELGALTVSMLRGEHGRQSTEVDRLVEWLEKEIRPDAIIFSNILIAGAIPTIRSRLPETRLIVLLQGDDVFLDHLPPTFQTQSIELCSEIATQAHQFVCHSEFYRAKMGEMFSIDSARIDVHPLSIDLPPASPRPPRDDRSPFRIGYFARIAPEKGLHLLADAFIDLAGREGADSVELHVAGWLGDHRREYLKMIKSKIDLAGLGDRFTYHGSPERDEKFKLLQSFDVLSVPAPYQDPKGLFILESLAVGTPVIQPDHGAFGELLRSTGGGWLAPPGDTAALADAIERVYRDGELRSSAMRGVREALAQRHSIETAAVAMRHACLS